MLVLVTALLFVVGCKATYQKDTLKESVKLLAMKEYNLDVEVEQVGRTLGVRFKVKNLLTELYSGDDSIYKQMNGLFTVLARVSLSSDVSPQFIVLDIVDEDNPQFRLVFTRYEEDLRKSMAEALSFTQTQDRLLEEFVIAGRRVTFDAQEMDLVRLMMMAIDSPYAEASGDVSPIASAKGGTPPPYKLEEVDFKDFVARVAENTLRRMLRERKEVNREAVIREVKANFDARAGEKGNFKMLIDMVAKPAANLAGGAGTVEVNPPLFIENTVLPLAAKEVQALFKSYRFRDFSGITVMEKNSGKILIVPGG